MEKRRLGRTGLNVTVVGLGGSPLGRENVTEEKALETVWASLEGGANLVDTSPHYGLGRSETRIGKALRERPGLAVECILSTKTGHYGWEKDYSYDRTLRSVSLSLERLGVNYLPIVHIHDVHDTEELREILSSKAAHTALRRLQSEGVIGYIGIGTKSLDVLQLAVESGEFDVLMMANQYNLVEQAGRAIIEKARQRDVGVIIAGAYATGILAKGSADPRSRYYYRPATLPVREYVAKIEALCQEWGCSLPAAAARFCLRGLLSEAVTVLGARGRQQVEMNLRTVQEQIPPGFWAKLDAWMQTQKSS